MIIKTYTERSSAAALRRVRQEMGGEAVVLKTRQITGPDRKPLFEVTACLEKATVARTSDILPGKPTDMVTDEIKATPVAETPTVPKPALQPTASKPTAPSHDSSQSLQQTVREIDRKLSQLISLGIQPDGITRLEKFQTIHRRLKEADLPDDYIESFISSLVDNYDGHGEIADVAREKLVAQLSEMMLPSLNFEPGDKLVFVGPAGSGKSSVMGKLAADLVARQKQKVKLLTLDDFKMAAFDEICSYAEILGIDVIDSQTSTEEIDKDGDTITLVDSPALPARAEGIFPLAAKIDYINPTYRFAVFSSLIRSRDVLEISKQLKDLKPTHLIVTMQDLAISHGTVIAAARALGLKVAFVSDSPGGMGNLKTGDPDLLARKMLEMEVECYDA